MNASKAVGVVVCLAVFAASPSSDALAEDVMKVKTEYGGSLGFLLLKPDKPKAAVILFAGGKGHLGLSDSGELRSQKKSFLIGNREAFAEHGLMVAAIDAPAGMEDLRRTYRMSEKHGQDIAAVVRELKKIADVPVWLVGHSRGTYSAANGAIRLKQSVGGLILTSTVTKAREEYASYKTHPNGVLSMDLAAVKAPVLIVANRTDSCWSTPASNAEKLGKAFTGAAKATVKVFAGENEPRKDNCKWNGQHQYYGFQEKVISLIADFIKAH